jgi:TorA maturation chaperone TorD
MKPEHLARSQRLWIKIPLLLFHNHPDNMNTPDELLQAYNAMFMFLGGSVSLAPEESGLSHFCETGMLRNLPIESRNLKFLEASRLLKSPCPHKQQCCMMVGENYQSILAARRTSPAYPAASHWFNTGTDTNEHHRMLEEIYRRYGYSRDAECGLEADHLGIELLFTNLLIEKFLTEDDYEIKEMIRQDLVKFIAEEMLTWVPRWAEKVTEKSVTKCYTGISGLIIGSLEDVKDILHNQKLGL